MHGRFMAAAEEGHGKDCCRQPDWFKDGAATLQPLIASHSFLFMQWLCSHCYQGQQDFVAIRRILPILLRRQRMIDSSRKLKK